MANADTTFGITGRKSGDLYIGTKPITLIEGINDIKIDNDVYTGTPGLWELLTMKEPNMEEVTNDGMRNYSKILVETEAMFSSTKTGTKKIKSSSGSKYNNIIVPIYIDFLPPDKR